MKKCIKCLQEKSELDFYSHKRSKDKLQSFCKLCAKETVILWQKNNKDKINLRSSLYKKKNKVWLRETHLNYVSARHKRVKQSTPTWANIFFISEIYSLARLKTRLTNIPWQVDHIIPLHGKLVCGLHVENNLQVIPAKENAIKNNRY